MKLEVFNKGENVLFDNLHFRGNYKFCCCSNGVNTIFAGGPVRLFSF